MRWSEILAGYLAARATVLPRGERQLLDRWRRIDRTVVTVLASTRWQAIVLDGSGRRYQAGWETAAPESVVAGDSVTCWLLPTMLPTEHLVVRSTVPPTW